MRAVSSRHCIATAFLVTALLLSGVAPAGASPRTDRVAEARRVKAQVDRLDRDTANAAEDYNAAEERRAALERQIVKSTRALSRLERRVSVLQQQIQSRAAGMYRNGPTSFVEVLLGAEDFETFSATWDLLSEIVEHDADTARELKSLKLDRARTLKSLKQREDKAAEQARVMERRKSAIEAKLKAREQALRGLEAEIVALERAEEAERARAFAAVASVGGGASDFPPPTRAARSQVIEIARRYLGARYVWGAEGPNTFDCSGFTQYVFRQVGVNLPRVSRDQIGAGQRVSRSDLQPGDLVFFGSPIHHVGIYVGGGQMIHSPRTGDVVKISALHSDYSGATRP